MESKNSLDDFKVGDRVRIKPEWQNEDDDEFERMVIGASAGSLDECEVDPKVRPRKS